MAQNPLAIFSMETIEKGPQERQPSHKGTMDYVTEIKSQKKESHLLLQNKVGGATLKNKSKSNLVWKP